jgi:hypothetical protein
MASPDAPEAPDTTLQRVEELVQRTQRSVLEGMEGILQRQMTPLLDQLRRSVVDTTGEILNRHAEPLADGLKRALREAVEELQGRQLGPLSERIKLTLLATVEEIGQKYAAPLQAALKELLGETFGEVLRRHLEPAFDGARKKMLDSASSVREYVDLLIERVRQTLAEPIAQALRVQVPSYARRVGVRVIDNALAVTLFCVAAVSLFLGSVQGLQQVGLPSYVTYLLAGLAAVGVGLVFLRLHARKSESLAEEASSPPPGS